MQFKRILSIGSIWVVFTVFSLLLAGGDAWGQAPLAINYSSLSMSLGSSQDLSASGGCPPYNWSLSGGGTLTLSGGDNTIATYVAPTSNPYCANNPTIILTDCCRQIAELKFAITNETNDLAFGIYDIRRVTSSVCPYCLVWTWRTRYKCSGDVYCSRYLFMS